MALFTLADLHLACSVDKPMDIFGGRWQNYMQKIEKNWNAIVQPDDIVVIGGDVSWGIDLKEAKADFEYLNHLNGKKIILKGNHDLWWATVSKMNRFLQENGFENIEFLYNNSFQYQNIGICGTRGWFYEEEFKKGHDEKIFKRELQRLETSLKSAKSKNVDEIYCFLHYPPLYSNFCCNEIINLMKNYGVTRCIYGHLHSDARRWAVLGKHYDIDFLLVSGDHVDFTPVLLKK